METWRMPQIFITVQRHAHRPAGLPSESTALSSVWKATLSAEQNGFAACSWPTRLIHESPGQDMMDTPDVPGMAWIGSRLTPQIAWAA
jgi:hypothetical protein